MSDFDLAFMARVPLFSFLEEEGSGGFLGDWGPLALVFLVMGVVLWLGQKPLPADAVVNRVKIFYRQLFFILMLVALAIGLIYAAPMEEAKQEDLLQFFGVVLSGAIALSSTTFLGNIMAGFMLRSLRNFKPGDFLRVGEFFGRVTESGLFHVEIQTEDRDLTTLPNMYLIARPMEVVRSSGTIVSADVSLGYDVNRARVKELLITAGESIGLEDPFVRIIKLGNYSIEYKLGGLLVNVRSFLSTQTKLRAAMIDALHAGGIEIASPAILSTRAFDAGRDFVPSPMTSSSLPEGEADTSFEDLAFDKANRAGMVELMREDLEQLESQRQNLNEQRGEAKDKESKQAIDAKLESLKQRTARVKALIEGKAATLESED